MVDAPELFQRIFDARADSLASEEIGLEGLPDESMLANIESIAHRIREAIYQNEPMIIFGHDDPDGITSSYILYSFLNSCGYQKHSYYIPNRNLEAHGIQPSFIEHVRKGGYKLVITVDNGIAAYDGVQALNELGCDVIITDHHLIQPDLLPDAYGILNPHLPDCEYPYKSLAGVGVVLMLIRYLARTWEHPISEACYFWTAVGSIADKVPMTGLNRIIVRHVIKNFNRIQDNTADFLLRNYRRLDSQTDIFNFLSYTSRFIANGREADGEHTAMRFILQLSHAKAKLFEELEEQRSKWEDDLNRVFLFLDSLAVDFVGNYFVYFDDDDVIPYSLMGTASSYIVNRLGIPAIMLKYHNGKMVCEGRCDDGFNMVHAFNYCKDNLIQFGGHAKAAGFTMLPESYDSFLECFNDYILDNFNNDKTDKTHEFDSEAKLSEMTPECWKKLEYLLPWGQMNPEPQLLLRKVSAKDFNPYWNFDNSGLKLPEEGEFDVIVVWKNPNQVKIIQILE
jgi:single-stranded-DNA-specific exonuclease